MEPLELCKKPVWITVKIMAKVYIDKIVPAGELSKRRKTVSLVKKIVIAGFAVLTVIGGFLIYKYLPEEPRAPQTEQIKKLAEKENQNQSDFEASPEADISSKEKISLEEKIQTLSIRARVLNENGDLLLNPESGDFLILFFPESEQFNISITRSPFETIRNRAEEEFLSLMGFDTDFICNLNVTITTPRYANPMQAGKSYSLSFCEKLN